MDDMLLIMTIVAAVILALMIFVIRVGLKNTRRDDLMAAPLPEELTGLAAGERVAVLPDRPDMLVDKAPSVLNPDRAKDDTELRSLAGSDAPSAAASPWGAESQPESQPELQSKSALGDNEVESSYGDEQLMEREIKALLLQGRGDRAVAHVMKVKNVDEAAADAIVAGYADADQA